MTEKQSRAWSWRHAILEADISSECTFLLLALSCFMNEVGESCFPTVDTISKKTKRGRSWVHKYIAEACEKGWLERRSISRKTKDGDNRGWRRNEYSARWPDKNITSDPVDVVDCLSEKGSPRHGPPYEKGSPRHGPPCEKGSPRECEKVVRDTHTTSPYTPSKILSSSDEDDLQNEKYWKSVFWKIVEQHPNGRQYHSVKWQVAFFELSPDDRENAAKLHSSWVQSLKQAGRTSVPGLADYFTQRLFEGVELVYPRVRPLVIKPYSLNWLGHRLWLLCQGPTGRYKPDNFQRKMIEQGKEELLLSSRYRAEFPEIAMMDEGAFNGDEYRLLNPVDLVRGQSEQIERGSERWNEWERFHHEMDWPWLDLPAKVDKLCLPITLDQLRNLSKLDANANQWPGFDDPDQMRIGA